MILGMETMEKGHIRVGYVYAFCVDGVLHCTGDFDTHEGYKTTVYIGCWCTVTVMSHCSYFDLCFFLGVCHCRRNSIASILEP